MSLRQISVELFAIKYRRSFLRPRTGALRSDCRTSMTVFLNGRFIPEAQAVIPISDRGFLYGDGLFETLRVSGGQPLWWAKHVERFERGAGFLRIKIPWPGAELRQFATKLIEQNATPEAVLRITLTRGSGSRGYSPKGAETPTLAMTLHPLPPALQSVRLATASFRVPANDPLSNIKSANKLACVMARAEAEENGADEALLLNTDGNIAEAASSNLFWLENGAVCTPPVADGALAGVTREIVLELCKGHEIRTSEQHLTAEQLSRADGVFLTNSVIGVVPVGSVDGRILSTSPFTAELRDWFSAAQEVEANT